METIWGYKRLICPKCPAGSKVSKRKATYKVYETNTYLILICLKCGHRIEINKKDKGKQIKYKIK